MASVMEEAPPREGFIPKEPSKPTLGSNARVAAIVALAIAGGIVVFHLSSSMRSSNRFVQEWKGSLTEESAKATMEQQRREQSRKTGESLEAALEDFESAAAQEAQQQAELAEEIRIAHIVPPPPPAAPPPPMLTRNAWEAQVREEAHDRAVAGRIAKFEAIDRRYWANGDWYWKASRTFQEIPIKPPRYPQCFQNSTDRGNDFWAPIPSTYARNKRHLPIYDSAPTDLNKPKASCFMGRSPRRGLRRMLKGSKKEKKQVKQPRFVVPTCPRETDELLMGRFQSKECTLKPLQEEMLLYLLRFHRVWFFGDYNMQSVAKTLQCVMAPFRKEVGAMDPGRITGVRPEYQRFGMEEETELIYVYVGAYKQPPPAKGKTNPAVMVEGLGADIRSKHGLDATLLMNQHATEADLVKLHELADAVHENMENFRPSDIIVLNIGNDHSEPRSYQASLLKFLRLYEDNAEHLPVVIWQETTAQHHLEHKGGDRLAEHKGGAPPVDPMGVFQEEFKCGNINYKEMEESNWRNQLANRLVEAASIPILRIWKSSTEWHNQYSGRCPGSFCANFGPCRYHCWPGPLPLYISETLVTVLDSDPLQEVLNSRANKTVPWWQWEPALRSGAAQLQG